MSDVKAPSPIEPRPYAAQALDHLCAALVHPIRVPSQRLPEGAGLPLPSYAHEGDAGLDLQAAIDDSWSIAPGAWMKVPTGFAFAIPRGFNGEVRSRSGLSSKKGLVVHNQPGTIDASYRGQVSVLLRNTSSSPQTIERGERIAQLVIAPVANAEVSEVADLDSTSRGAGGFGSTGS